MNPLVRRALTAYDGAPRGVRMHTHVRAWTCPLAELECRAPDGGRVLDFGCGHGLLSIVLALGASGREVLGVDVDADKIGAAVAAASLGGVGNVSFETVAPGWQPGHAAFDGIAVNDVLYLLGAASARRVLRDLADGLAPGGVLLVKEIDVHPRWKYELARVQEVVATRVARITEGDAVDFLPPEEIGAVLAAAGLEVAHTPLHRGRLHPHHLVLARRR